MSAVVVHSQILLDSNYKIYLSNKEINKKTDKENSKFILYVFDFNANSRF